MSSRNFTVSPDPLNESRSSRKRKVEYTEFSDCSKSSKSSRNDGDEEDEETSDIPRGAFKFLKINVDKKKILFKIDTLEKKNKQLITENEAIKRENKMLRENNIKFQLAIYDLENQDKPNQTKQHENYVVVQELKSPALSEVMNETTAFVDEFEVFDHASDVADEFEAVEHKPKMSNYSMERQKDIIDKYSISMEDTDIYQLDNIEEGSKNDQKFINKLLLILFDRNTLAYSSVSGKTNKNNKFQSDRCQKLDTNKVDFIKDLLGFRITRENVDLGEKDERLKKLNYMIKAKINNLRKSTIKSK